MMQRDGKFVVNRRNMSRRSSPFLGRFLQPYSGATSIFVDEVYTGGFESALYNIKSRPTWLR
jgi:hypothetical protein